MSANIFSKRMGQAIGAVATLALVGVLVSVSLVPAQETQAPPGSGEPAAREDTLDAAPIERVGERDDLFDFSEFFDAPVQTGSNPEDPEIDNEIIELTPEQPDEDKNENASTVTPPPGPYEPEAEKAPQDVDPAEVDTLIDDEEILDDDDGPERPDIELEGLNFFERRSLREKLDLLEDDYEERTYYSDSHVDNILLITRNFVTEKGFLAVEVEADITTPSGERMSFVIDEETPINHEANPARQFRIVVDRGPMHFYESVTFKGLTAMEREEAVEYFYSDRFLIKLKRDKKYTQELRNRSVNNLRKALHDMGYAEAEVEVLSEEIRDDGSVSLQVSVTEGQRHIVAQTREQIVREESAFPLDTDEIEFNLETQEPDAPYNAVFRQDWAKGIRNRFYEMGYPNVSVEIEVTEEHKRDGTTYLGLVALIKPGQQVTIGEIRYEDTTVRESVLDKTIDLQAGDLLNPLEIEEARYDLAALTTFEIIDVETPEAPDEPELQDVVFTFEEKPPLDVFLLANYNTYEQLGVGVEITQRNLWRRTHEAEYRVTQSFKASTADFYYRIPSVLDRFAYVLHANALRREELSFDRQEIGFEHGLSGFIQSIDSRVALTYSWEALDTDGIATEEDGPRNANAASLGFLISHDKRDDILMPREGYNLFAEFEVSERFMGSNVTYQRFEAGGSYHQPLFLDGVYGHFGLRQGISFEGDLPINKRFFPGGSHSIRGFESGGATPRNDFGEHVGTTSYTLLNFELERELTSTFSFVLFQDVLFYTPLDDDFPATDELFSTGVGLRAKTPLGPLRLEYAHNLNPRPSDPSDRIYFSIGYPF